MSDTSPGMDARYRSMLMARSGEERLKIGDSMYATARALVTASILERDRPVSSAAQRQAVFLRFYGHEFDAATRERILARLASADARDARRAGKRLPIDWEELEVALTWHGSELAFFLDVRTGEVRRHEGFAHEAEDDEITERDLIRIEPIPSPVEYDWMVDFAASVPDARLRGRLERALHGRGPFRRFKDALGPHPAERERWFRFHDERTREAMRAWLEDHDIEPTTTPLTTSSPTR